MNTQLIYIFETNYATVKGWSPQINPMPMLGKQYLASRCLHVQYLCCMSTEKSNRDMCKVVAQFAVQLNHTKSINVRNQWEAFKGTRLVLKAWLLESQQVPVHLQRVTTITNHTKDFQYNSRTLRQTHTHACTHACMHKHTQTHMQGESEKENTMRLSHTEETLWNNSLHKLSKKCS